MSTSRIEQIIEEIEEYIEGCRYQPLSTTKIVVNKEELEELLRELRLKTPDEIKRYQKIISNKDAILADAQQKADAAVADAEAQAEQIVAGANEEAQRIVSETEIMKSAYNQANETVENANQQAQDILDKAQEDANNIRMSAISYTDQLLSNISSIMGNTLSEMGEKFDDFNSSLNRYYNLVNDNRRELAPMEESGVYAIPPQEEEPEEEES